MQEPGLHNGKVDLSMQRIDRKANKDDRWTNIQNHRHATMITTYYNSLKHFSFHLLMQKETYYHLSQQNTIHHTILEYTIQHKDLNMEIHKRENHKSTFHLALVVSRMLMYVHTTCKHLFISRFYIIYAHTTCRQCIVLTHNVLLIFKVL